MRQQGRPAPSALAVIAQPLDVVERQKAPHELTDEQTEVWASVVNTMPAEWFNQSSVPLLTQYCRHVVSAKRIAELIEKIVDDRDFTVSEYNRLLRMQDLESRIICTLATKMRLSQQSTFSDKLTKKTPNSSARKPWQR